MRILGVDPGLGVTGYGIIEAISDDSRKQECLYARQAEGFKLLEAGVIKSSSGEALPLRLARIYRGLQELIAEYKPTDLILEKLYSHYKHQMTAIAMAHARGVIALTAQGNCSINLVDYSAKRVKKAITGNGNASKLQVARTVQSILGLKKMPSPADLSDALALAIAHFFIVRVRVS